MRHLASGSQPRPYLSASLAGAPCWRLHLHSRSQSLQEHCTVECERQKQSEQWRRAYQVHIQIAKRSMHDKPQT